MSADLVQEVWGIGVCVGFITPVMFWIAISLHRIANHLSRQE